MKSILKNIYQRVFNQPVTSLCGSVCVGVGVWLIVHGDNIGGVAVLSAGSSLMLAKD